MSESGPNVVGIGSGSFDLAGLTYVGRGGEPALLFPSAGYIALGPLGIQFVDVYPSISGPTSFGPASFTFPTSGSGDPVSVVGLAQRLFLLFLPHGYVSGAPLSSQSTWDNASFASLGVTPGVYTWTWGSGANADSYILRIENAPPAPAPEPLSLSLFGAGVAAAAMLRRRKR